MDTPLTPPVVTPVQPKKKRSRRWLWFIPGLIVGAYVVIALGICQFGWTGKVGRSLSRYVPVPVGMLNWRPLLAHSVLEQTRALEVFQAYQKSSSLPTDVVEDARASAVTKVIKDAGLEAMLKKYDLTISDSEISTAYAAQVAQTGSTDTIESALKELYGWTPVQFQRYVVRQDVGRDKLMSKLSFDESLSKTQAEQAATVKSQISADGANMAEIAKRYSQDAYASNGGETDFISRGDLTSELEDVAFSLDLKKVSDVIHTKYGFHVIQVVERKGEGDDAQVKLRSIFIAAPSVDDAVEKYLADHAPKLWLRGFRWDSATKSAVAT